MTTLVEPTRRRRRIVVRGVVQGVGFRPFVATLAADVGLEGHCHNDTTCVVIEVEGQSELVIAFEGRLESEAPPLSRILSVEATDLPVSGETGFAITPSASTSGARTLVAPDSAVCDACLDEMHDPADRRHRHPFITCTHCGPRFTIIRDLPYDRPATTMAAFSMCARCAAEYADMRDRRYHAQPISCHDCGPTLSVRDRRGTVLATGTEASLLATVAALRGGAIVAIKGIGGYHLACDASSCTAALVLRERKQRPDQPFAVMVRDLATAHALVEVGDAGSLLSSAERPIVVLPRRCGAPVADCVAPGLDELGVLLPYAPLHHLLFADLPDGSPGAPFALVMTSGNLSGEPLCFDDADAIDRLSAIADLFLTHDREIAVPCEDSLLAWDGAAVPLRRSRGFAPMPVPMTCSSVVLAAGAEIKNTVALARDDMAFVSAHVGDLGGLAGRDAHDRATAQLLGFHASTPDLVVADRHPGYASRSWARARAGELGVPLLEVQHHHAHLASLAAEHGRLDDRLLGVVFDGTGYGCDGGVWGGELLLLDHAGTTATRVAHLGTVRLPGGDAGVRHPVRTAALALLAAGVALDGTPVGDELTELERRFLTRAATSTDGWTPTSSVGRLFDVVSSVLGVRHRITYEAQAAIELEAAARRWTGDVLALPFPDLDPDPLVRALAAALADGVPVEQLACSFHVALASSTADLAVRHAAEADLDVVGLTGGVFANRLLLGLLRTTLELSGLEVLTHRLVPSGDGGLSLGQVAVGVRTLQRNPLTPARPARPAITTTVGGISCV